MNSLSRWVDNSDKSGVFTVSLGNPVLKNRGMDTSSSTAVTIESLEWDSFMAALSNRGIWLSVVVVMMMMMMIRSKK